MFVIALCHLAALSISPWSLQAVLPYGWTCRGGQKQLAWGRGGQGLELVVEIQGL